MFGSPFVRSNGQSSSTPPSHFKDSARSAIYQRLPSVSSPSASSIRSAPSFQQYNKQIHQHHSFKSSNSSIFSKRSARSAPSRYSSSSVTIPEDSEPVSTTVEQFVNDIQLHETHFQQEVENGIERKTISLDDDTDELYKISLGSGLMYQNTPESLIDWNLNVTRCKLILIQMPMVSAVPELHYSSGSFPLLVGDLAQTCHLVLIQPHIPDKELIYTLYSSDLYQEHNLDAAFKKSVAEISVKQSPLLQINSPTKGNQAPITSADNQAALKFKYKEIALRNYLINLAAAATTAHEYKIRSDEVKKQLNQSTGGKKIKLSKDDKKRLWDQVRSDVFKRAGLEE
ncbi:transcription factor [Yamadazyma tenuis]|uniref:Uncharacterized protein n=1 Tax=Candida tenuis (strain ATCC 10573 / BCRC 21748 / CBS 615 / JCM 9827 / NBRC 10315 / NRRL Y-1498 / VKM Y-70) TaxID=590646 RepID=G3BFU5_CANTC|nr:uncharacterized protein CANTEDRAFT_111860 [Yamadazyma tenuis ATCC 10573]EGV60731.1 hypothetical protein CANTEDRAFT_111860 [Yamadazyma tenuis ATCC 10573]WEJ94001.1 transcription factor [Yamadazyma tenuis]